MFQVLPALFNALIPMSFAELRRSYHALTTALAMEAVLQTLGFLNVNAIMAMVVQTASTSATKDALRVMVLMKTNALHA